MMNLYEEAKQFAEMLEESVQDNFCGCPDCTIADAISEDEILVWLTNFCYRYKQALAEY